MLKRMINSARIELDIIPIDPLLIKSGQATVAGVDMAFVRTYRHGDEDEPFIPGSSLKGMFRSYAEKICRSLRENPVPVCLPYLKPNSNDTLPGEERQDSCGLRFEDYKRRREIKTVPSTEAYSLSCPVCRLFGSHVGIGRFATSDAYLKPDFQRGFVLETRDGVAIDRLTGGAAKGAKYDLEVLTRGEFQTSIELRNFERWQLALVGLMLRDMEQGLVRMGFGKSRGLGRFEAAVKTFSVAYFNRQPDRLCGIWALCPEGEREAYGFYPETDADSPPLPDAERNGLRDEYNLNETWQTVLEPGVTDLIEMIGAVDWPRRIETYCN